MAKKTTDNEVESFLRRFRVSIVAILGLFFVLAIYAFYLDQKLNEFKSTLQHSPPQELEIDEFFRGDLFHLPANPVQGQLVYVPAYSHVYQGDGQPLLLTITLSVRNTSVDSEIVVKAIRYFDTKGKEIKSYLEKPVRLPALGTTEVVVERDDATGGSGANFLTEWYSNTPVCEPIIEAVMVDTKLQQGIAFVRRGVVISQVVPDSPAGSE